MMHAHIYYVYMYMYVAIYCTHTKRERDIYIYREWEKKLDIDLVRLFLSGLKCATENSYQCHSIELSTSFLLDLDFQNIFKKCSPRIDLACCEPSITKQQRITMHSFYLPCTMLPGEPDAANQWLSPTLIISMKWRAIFATRDRITKLNGISPAWARSKHPYKTALPHRHLYSSSSLNSLRHAAFWARATKLGNRSRNTWCNP